MSNLTTSKTGTFYFAFGSNLSAHQMSLRLPTSRSSSAPVAVVLLHGYRWIICERGYANVVPGLPGDKVYGILYNLDPADEAILDLYEGHNRERNPDPEVNMVPDLAERTRKPYLQGGWDYNKLYLEMEVVKWIQEPKVFGIDGRLGPKSVRGLIYVDEFRLTPGVIAVEYIGRMNRGIEECVALGVPREWCEEVMRPFIPKGIWVDDEGYIGDQRGYVIGEALATGAEGQDITERELLEMRRSREEGVVE